MARPLKDGIDYFPMDTDFLKDRKIKLIKAEFGVCGVLIVLSAFCLIYSNNGYYTSFDEEDELLLADDIGCGCTRKLVHEVVRGCCRRSIFDGGVLDTFNVLTSRGIQRRYLRAVAKRDNIPIISEYWLLDVNDRDDVPDGIRNRLTFKNISVGKNPDISTGNPVDSSDNTQSKVKESKVKESREECGNAAASPPARTRFLAPSLDEVRAYCKERGNRVDANRFIDYYTANGWMVGKNRMKDWKAAIRTWEQKDNQGQAKETLPGRPTAPNGNPFRHRGE